MRLNDERESDGSSEVQGDAFLKEDLFRDLKVNEVLIKSSIEKLREIGMTDLASEIGYMQHRMFALTRSITIAKRIIKDYRAEGRRPQPEKRDAGAIPAPPVPPLDADVLRERIRELERQLASTPDPTAIEARIEEARNTERERVRALERQLAEVERAQLTQPIITLVDDHSVLHERIRYLESQVTALESAQLTHSLASTPNPAAMEVQIELARKAERERIISLLIQDNADLSNFARISG